MNDYKPLALFCCGLIVGAFGGFAWAFQNVEYKMVSTLAVEKANQTCGTCFENVDILYRNFQVMQSKCSQDVYELPESKNVSILPGVIDDKVKVYGP